MKNILFIIAALGVYGNSFAQESVTNRNGKEISVNTDATTTAKGIIKLAGDLGGTADAPTIPSLTNKLEGSGTINYIPKFTAEKTLGNSQLFDDGTNVGIGTILPLSKFSNAANTSNFVSSNNSIQSAGGISWLTTTNGYNTSLYNANTGVGANGLQVKVASSSSSTMAFEVGQNGTINGTSVPLFNVLANGNVGVKTNSPSAPLVVQGVTGTGALKLIAPSVAAGDNWWLGFGHGTTSTDANDRARIGVDMAGGGSGRLFFTTGSTGAQTRAMFIDESQRVGIGTSAPTGQLEVATNNGLSLVVRRGGPSSQTPANLILQKTWGADANTNTAVPNGELVGRIVFSAANGSSYPTNGTDIVGYAAGTQSVSNNGGGIIFRTVPQNSSNAALERMRIDENGRVGIATVTPNTSSILDITSTSSGVLIPRMTTTQRTAITNTADALLVYDTDVKMFYYYNAATSNWTPINVGTINSQTGSYTLTAADNGRVIDINSATAVTLTVPSTLPIGFQVSITQAGAGQVTISGGTGMTVNNRYSANKTSGQWAKAGLEVRASGSAVLSGDVQ